MQLCYVPQNIGLRVCWSTRLQVRHSHVPNKHEYPLRQVPQDPPQPSGPQFFPLQSGVQPPPPPPPLPGRVQFSSTSTSALPIVDRKKDLFLFPQTPVASSVTIPPGLVHSVWEVTPATMPCCKYRVKVPLPLTTIHGPPLSNSEMCAFGGYKSPTCLNFNKITLQPKPYPNCSSGEQLHDTKRPVCIVIVPVGHHQVHHAPIEVVDRLKAQPFEDRRHCWGPVTR